MFIIVRNIGSVSGKILYTLRKISTFTQVLEFCGYITISAIWLFLCLVDTRLHDIRYKTTLLPYTLGISIIYYSNFKIIARYKSTRYKGNL